MKPILPLLVLASLSGTPVLAQDRFLADGGGIRTERLVGSPYGPAVLEVPALGEGRPFLEDGGGIRFAPELPRLGRDGSYGQAYRGGYGPSVTEVPDNRRAGGYGGRNVSVIVIQGAGGEEAREPSVPGYGGAKILRVATARLDQRPFDASGRDVVQSGTTKIIRIAPGAGKPVADTPRDETLELDNGEDLATLEPRREPAPRPYLPPRNETSPRNGTHPVAAPAPTPRPSEPQAEASVSPAAGFEPWTADWLRDCVRRYPNFDASLGTYNDETGRRRFCTGEP